MIGDTSKYKVARIRWNDGRFAIAEGFWNKEPQIAIAMRWHHDESGDDLIGYPQTYGKPQWFVLPTEIGRALIIVLDMVSFIKNIK